MIWWFRFFSPPCATFIYVNPWIGWSTIDGRWMHQEA